MTFALYLLAAVTAAGTTLAVAPLWSGWCRRRGLMDDPGHRKIHEAPVPLSGGLAILTALILPLALAGTALLAGMVPAEVGDRLIYGFQRRWPQLVALIGGAIGMTLLGWLDDRHELRAGPKFAGQLLIATLVAAAGIRITLFVPSVVFSYLVTILWILTVTNAFNFMDNMNGLCTGLGTIAALLFGAAAARHDHYLVAALCFLVAGAIFGFLPRNFPRASAFLGDAGSHLTGFLMSVLAILPHYYSDTHPRALAVLSPVLILAIPLADLVWVVILRWRANQPFYVGDTNHLSHRLVRSGLTPPRAVALIWLLALTVGCLVFLL